MKDTVPLSHNPPNIAQPKNEGLGLRDRFTNWLIGGRKADENIPKEKELLEMVQRVAKKHGCDTPNLLIFTSKYPFAGSVIFSKTIIVDTKIMDVLNSAQMEAIIGHEMVHQKKHGMKGVAVFFGSIIASCVAWHKIAPALGIKNRHLESFARVSTAMAGWLAHSRAMEFEADRESAKISGKPLELAESLEVLVPAIERIQNQDSNLLKDTLLQIPPRGVKNVLKEIYASHPSLEDRVTRLKAMDAANKESALKMQR
jgi:heat shock protein HtpX